MMQMYELGQFFRKRYASFITKFNTEDVSSLCFPFYHSSGFFRCEQKENLGK